MDKRIKKAAIITMTQFGQNYGNRLQNYALQEILNNLGVYAETIWHSSNPVLFSYMRIKKRIKVFVKSIIKHTPFEALRYERFDSFNLKYICYSKIGFGNNRIIGKKTDRYDFFIVGSDQVWNTNYRFIQENLDIFLAAFAPPSMRIAYAASFGVKDITDECVQKFNTELPKFKWISVREEAGIEIAEKYGAEATVVLDPTMMLRSDEWDRVSKKPKYMKSGSYIVTYFLGGRNKDIDEYINSVSNGKRIINLEAEWNLPHTKEERSIYVTAPDEFVWLISHADCVLTDSFHASVFSILYHKPFFVYERLVNGKSSGMEGRLDTLLGTFGLEMCRGDINHPEGIPLAVNWDSVGKILEEEREKSLAFLKRALETE